jgi:hypothetical protein
MAERKVEIDLVVTTGAPTNPDWEELKRLLLRRPVQKPAPAEQAN